MKNHLFRTLEIGVLLSGQFDISFPLYEEVPLRYSGSSWYVERRDPRKLVAFPVIGYARKFSSK